MVIPDLPCEMEKIDSESWAANNFGTCKNEKIVLASFLSHLCNPRDTEAEYSCKLFETPDIEGKEMTEAEGRTIFGVKLIQAKVK
jgi:hypothetical protein